MNVEGAKPVTDSNESNKTSSDTVSESAEVKNALTEIDTLVKELKESLADKASEIEELHALASEQERKFSEEKALLTSKVTELESAMTEAVKAKEVAENELKTLKEEALLNERLAELSSKSLIAKTEEKRIRQAERVKNMTAEEFAEYVAELSDICEQVVGNSAKANETVSKIAEKVAEKVETTPEVIQKVVDNMNMAEEKAKEATKEVASVKEEGKSLRVTDLANALSLIAKRKNT